MTVTGLINKSNDGDVFSATSKGGGIGIYGESLGFRGVWGDSTTGDGVFGSSVAGSGISGLSGAGSPSSSG